MLLLQRQSMLDQTFSSYNFKTIYEIENRYGKIDSKFISEKYGDIIQEIKDLKKLIKEYKQKTEDDPEIIFLNTELNRLLQEKDQELEDQLLDFSLKINKNTFSLPINSFVPNNGKTIYTISDNKESFFAIKQLQYNLNRCFKVKQANRHIISKQLKEILSDNTEKYIVRTDIKEFYETVPQYELLNFIKENPLISPLSIKLIKNVIYHYNVHTNQLNKVSEDKTGIPRGIGVSAYLAELYMRSIDKNIREIPDLIFYARYVDDIIAIFRPKEEKDKSYYINQIDKIVKQKKLRLNRRVKSKTNEAKTIQIDGFSINNEELDFTFLGYRFHLKNKVLFRVALSRNKFNKYEKRINLSLNHYIKCKLDNRNINEARRLLIHRFNYITKNVRLLQPKKGLIGIYYSNNLLDSKSPCLEDLNTLMRKLINTILTDDTDDKLKYKLNKFCFKKGFTEKLFFNISGKKRNNDTNLRGKNIPDLRSKRLKQLKPSINNFEKIVSIWKNEE